MGYKKQRFGQLLQGADARARYRDVHFFFGGTGAVGGTALLQTLAIYEEWMTVVAPAPDEIPELVATGHTPDEMDVFEKRLFRLIEARHGRASLPRKVGS